MTATNIEGLFPLTPMQRGIIFDAVSRPDSRIHVGHFSFTIGGPLDAAAFRRAWQAVVDRHDALRMLVVLRAGRDPLQVVRTRAEVPFEEVDWRHVADSNQQHNLKALVLTERARGVDFGVAPLMRMRLIRRADDLHQLLWTYHKLALDGWSLSLALREVLETYEALLRGEEVDLTAAQTWRAFVSWLDARDRTGEEAFWRSALHGSTACCWPSDGARPLGSSADQHGEHEIRLSGQLSQAVQGAAPREGVPASALFEGAWALLLSRYAGNTRVAFGITVAGRGAGPLGVESIVGPCLNTLPMQIDARPDARTGVWLREIAASQLEMLRFEHASPAELQRWAAAATPWPFFDTLLVIENYPAIGPGPSGSWRLRDLELRQWTDYPFSASATEYPLTVVVELGSAIVTRFAYERSRFSEQFIRELGAQWQDVLIEIARSPDAALRTLGNGSGHAAIRGTGPIRVAGATLPEWFSATASERSEEIAVIDDGPPVTYGALDAASNQLAWALRESGIGREHAVGVCLPRTRDLVTALLAVNKAGAAYVPIDADTPPARAQALLEDSGARMVLTDDARRRGLESGAQRVISLDGDRGWLGMQRRDPVAVSVTPGQLAYILYTSGSTGRPKGVMVSHAAVTRLIGALRDPLALEASDVWTLYHSAAFDFSVWEYWGALLTGARLVIVPYWISRTPAAFWDLVARERVTVLNLTPSAFALIGDAVSAAGSWRPRVVVLGGEAVAPADLARWLVREGDERPRLFNMYGITETTVHSTLRRISTSDADVARSLIGDPLADVHVSVVDASGRSAPRGAVAELWVGGPGVARGYVGDPGLTALRFVPDVAGRPGARIYRSGDWGRRTDSGELEYRGRRDGQVKLRGHRIELGEVTSALKGHPDVRDAAAIVRGNGPAAQIHAYVVTTAGGPGGRALQAWLRDRVPAHLVPGAVVVLPALPLTPHGKLDRAALPEPPFASADTDSSAPTPLEALVAQTWAAVLGVPAVGRAEAWLDLGGHSILALQVADRLEAALGKSVPVRLIFESSTVAALAATLEARETDPSPAVCSQDPCTAAVSDDAANAAFPLTDVQAAYWVGRDDGLVGGQVGSHLYLELDGVDLDLVRLGAAWRALIARHGMLRAVVTPDGRQVIHTTVPPYEIAVRSVSSAGEWRRAVRAARAALAHIRPSAHTWPLFEVRATTWGRRVRMHVSLDALIVDAWSLQILLEELEQLYAHPERPLPAVTLTFSDYVKSLERAIGSARYREAEAYWSRRVVDMRAGPDLPLRPAPALAGPPRFRRLRGRLRAADWRSLQARARAAGLTSAGLLLAAFSDVVSEWSATPEYTLTLTLFQRLSVHPDVDRVVGDFTSLTLLAVDGAAGSSFVARARRLQAQLWEDLAHRAMSGVAVLRAWRQRHGGGAGGLMPVVFTSTLDGPRAGDGGRSWLRPGYGLTQTPQVWLDHQVTEVDGVLRYQWDYQPAMYADGVIEAMWARYGDMLRRLVRDTSTWHEARPAAFEEREGVGGAVTVAVGGASRLEAGFVAQVAARPDAVAVVQGDTAVTYAALGVRAGQVTTALRARGVGVEEAVGVALPPGGAQVGAVLGIVGAGAAYVPLDPSWPAARVAAALRGVRWVLTDAAVAAQVAWPAGVTPVLVETLPPGGPAQVGPGGAAPLAYVIYTSGTTGTPKGVMMTHGAAQTTVQAVCVGGGVGPADRGLALSALSFDLSVFDVFGLLGVGGTLVLPTAEERREPRAWGRLLVRAGVTVWNSVPALLQVLVDGPGAADVAAAPLRLVLLSGDWIPRTLPARLHAARPTAQLISLGGATEDGIWSVQAPVTTVEADWASVPYGVPLPGHTAAVRSARGTPCPPWVAGALLLGGTALARGYWQDPAQTAARFVPDPAGVGARCYRTGDRARWRPGPTLELLGRVDAQVKLHGYRVELEEIERAVAAHPAVTAAAARLVPGPPPRLYAYAVAAGPLPTPAEWRAFLGTRLPAPVVPAAVLPLAQLPLTATGKVDRRQLPDPPAVPAVETLGAAPDVTVTRLQTIVADILNVPPPDRGANLLDLGANSVDILRLANRFEEEFGFRPDIEGFYHTPTIEQLARAAPSAAAVSCARILDPREREAFKKTRPGVRRDIPADGAIALADEDPAARQLFAARRSHRHFAPTPIRAAAFGRLLDALREIEIDAAPRHLYPSAGGLYAVQTCVHVKEGRVEDIAGGTYYYHPTDHALRLIARGCQIASTIHEPFLNRSVFQEAAFSLVFVADGAAVTPLYGNLAREFCLLEAGAMVQLLMLAAPGQAIGLCPIGELSFEPLRSAFALTERSQFIHALLGGAIATAGDVL